METFSQIDHHFTTSIFYPIEASIWQPGNAVYEGIFIQKVNGKRFVVHAQRHYATDPFQLAEKAEWVFYSLEGAFTKWSNLKNGIF